jgi:hypothetical protein
MLLAISVIAAMSMAAPSAFAQTVEVLDEDLAGQPHCGAVTAVNHVVSGGCTVHAVTSGVSTANLFAHVAGVGEVAISACNNEFEAHINEDGLGFITDQVLTGASCGLAPCDEAAPSHANLEWPLAAYEGGGGNDALATTFCIRPASAAEGASASYCSIVIDATQTGHAQTFTSTENSCVESANELSGTWVTDLTEGEIEITHAH